MKYLSYIRQLEAASVRLLGLSTVILSCLLSAASPVLGATYEWRDERGVTNFTDNPNKIPDRFRTRAIKRDSVMERDSNTISVQKPQAPAESDYRQSERNYSHRDVSSLRNNHAVLRQEMKRIMDALPEKRDRLAALHHRKTVFQKSRDRIAYNDLKAEIDKDEAKISELQDKIAALEDEAAKAGVTLQ